MTLLSKLRLASVLTTAAFFYGCSTGSDEHIVYAPQGHAVYTIWRPGGFISDENFDVAVVYGFNDNRVVAQQIVEFLNQEEPNTYFFSEKD